jgi:hypothetical protein
MPEAPKGKILLATLNTEKRGTMRAPIGSEDRHRVKGPIEGAMRLAQNRGGSGEIYRTFVDGPDATIAG